jgi:predicted permease
MNALDTFVNDARNAVRALRYSRAYALTVVATLAIGMAVTIAAFALLNASMLLPFPGVTKQERLVRVAVSRNCGRVDCWAPMSSPADYAALSEGLTGLESLAAYAGGNVSVGVPEARSMRALLASANYFDVLGVRPAIGRVFTTNDEKSAAPVAIIGHAVWMREFGGDPSVVGRSIRVAGDFVHIIGVAPSFFIGINRIRSGVDSPDIWLPIWLANRLVPLAGADLRRAERSVDFVGRLRSGVEIADVQAQAAVVAQRVASLRSGTPPAARAEVRRVWRVRPESWQFGVIIVLPIPILVLLIACVNAANLMLARGSQRQREIAVRLAIGASRFRIVRQLLVESALLVLAGTILALALAWCGLQFASNPLGTPIPFDAIVIACTVVTAAATTIAFGLMPAVRVSAQRPSTTLGTSAAHTDATPAQMGMRRLLIVVQTTLSLGLLATAWQLVSTVEANAVSSGTPANRLLIGRFDLQPLNVTPSATETFYADLLSGMSRLPGVEAAGIARATSVWSFGERLPASLHVWRPTDDADTGRDTGGGYVTGDLFQAVGIKVVAGHDFVDQDRHRGRPQVAVVNSAFAARMTGPVVGSTLRVAPRGRDFASGLDVRIVGIVESTVDPRLEDGLPGEKVYLPVAIEPESALAVYIRTADSAAALAQPVRELVSRIDPRVALQEIGSLQEFNERSFSQQLWLARAAVFVGFVGLLLATAGLYGISSYVVSMRAREIAIRVAVGARPGSILSMVLKQSMRVAMVGLIFGGISAVIASRIVQSEYHGIVGIDRDGFAAAAGLFLAAMLIASAVPAFRASRLDPVEKLKEA